MKKIHILLGVISLVTVSFQNVHAVENMAPELHIDPFVNPLKLELVESGGDSDEMSSQSSSVVNREPRKTFLWQPELRGIIRSEDIAIANMAGEMVELGMEYEGYRLIKVREQSVVFEKNGRKFPVSLDGTDVEESTL